MFTAAVAFAWNAGRMLVVDDRAPADVIVVLAGETDKRPALALQLLEQGYAKRVLIDVPAGEKVFGVSERQLAEKYVQGWPHAEDVAICPIVGLSTRDEAHDVENCLASVAGSQVLLVTSDYHTRRALSTFRHEVRGKSFSVAAAPDPAQFGERWWTHRQWAKICVEEWTRFFWWTVVERWR